MFCVLNKKMILLKKINIENCFLVHVGLSAIYLLKSVLHLKYEKITVINNISCFITLTQCRYSYRTRTPTCICLWHAGSSLYFKFIRNFWSANFHESVSLFNHCSIFKEKISVANFEKKKNSMWQDYSRTCFFTENLWKSFLGSQVRGVGAGGIVSSAFCLLYKLFTLKLTRKQLNGLITHVDSPYIRALGFMFIRYEE